MKLVVGLGNPGSRYRNNRHNVGYLVVEQVARANGAGNWQKKFDAQVADVRVGDETVLLLKPETFMNCSGRSVRKAVDFYQLPLDNLLVVCDDFNLGLGQLRIRSKGSAGGQNGLKDIIAHLGTDGFSRLRIGIGEPTTAEASSYVLGDFTAAEKVKVEESVIDAGRAVERWLAKGLQAAMNEFNSKERTKE